MRALAAAVMMIAAVPATCLAQPFKCGGTEPFWSLDIRERSISYKSPSFESHFDLEATMPDSARGMAADYVLVYRTHIVGAVSEPVTIVLQKAAESRCSDGMSDASYPFYVVLITRRNVLSGCCEIG